MKLTIVCHNVTLSHSRQACINARVATQFPNQRVKKQF